VRANAAGADAAVTAANVFCEESVAERLFIRSPGSRPNSSRSARGEWHDMMMGRV